MRTGVVPASIRTDKVWPSPQEPGSRRLTPGPPLGWQTTNVAIGRCIRCPSPSERITARNRQAPHGDAPNPAAEDESGKQKLLEKLGRHRQVGSA